MFSKKMIQMRQKEASSELQDFYINNGYRSGIIVTNNKVLTNEVLGPKQYALKFNLFDEKNSKSKGYGTRIHITIRKNSLSINMDIDQTFLNMKKYKHFKALTGELTIFYNYNNANSNFFINWDGDIINDENEKMIEIYNGYKDILSNRLINKMEGYFKTQEPKRVRIAKYETRNLLAEKIVNYLNNIL